jgi:hypothetical protein
MALLRQCLQEVRMRHHEWDVLETDWPEPTWAQPGTDDMGRLNGCGDEGSGGYAFHPGLTADQRHLS